MRPISTEADNLFLPADVNNRFITVPFDNDGFITYASYPLSCSQTDPESLAIGRVARDSVSMEVSAIFNGETQLGLVIGSVDHDTWKSAVRITGSPLAQGKITNLECFSGVTHHITRDMIDGVLKPHGAVKGQQVKSARMIVHYSGDWRTGLETLVMYVVLSLRKEAGINLHLTAGVVGAAWVLRSVMMVLCRYRIL